MAHRLVFLMFDAAANAFLHDESCSDPRTWNVGGTSPDGCKAKSGERTKTRAETARVATGVTSKLPAVNVG